MSDSDRGDSLAYVDAAAALLGMMIRPERVPAVTVVMSRIAEFAADLDAFDLDDQVEVAGMFRP